jgi:hypothetical protein
MKISKISPTVLQTSRLLKYIFSSIWNYNLRSDQISIIDDLAFAMYQDPEIATIIKNLDRKKQEYVHGKNSIKSFFFHFYDFFFISRWKIWSSSKI